MASCWTSSVLFWACFTLALLFWNQIWMERSDIFTFLARISRTLELGDWFVKKVSSRIASCSTDALVRFLDVVLVGDEADKDGDEEGSPQGEF